MGRPSLHGVERRNGTMASAFEVSLASEGITRLYVGRDKKRTQISVKAKGKRHTQSIGRRKEGADAFDRPSALAGRSPGRPHGMLGRC